MSASQRLFIGIDLPDDAKAVLAGLDPHYPGLRWLPAEQFHLTLSFLGEVATSRQPILAEALASVRVPPFFLPLRGVGAFHPRSRPAAVWVGVGQGHPHLFALHQHLQTAVLQAGFEPDLRPFQPHVTTGRAPDLSREALQPFLRQHRETEWGLLRVEEFMLFSSVPTPAGSRYRIESRHRLRRNT